MKYYFCVNDPTRGKIHFFILDDEDFVPPEASAPIKSYKWEGEDSDDDVKDSWDKVCWFVLRSLNSALVVCQLFKIFGRNKS